MTHSARETLKRIGDLIEVALKMTVQLGEDSDLHLRALMNALENVYLAIDDIDTDDVRYTANDLRLFLTDKENGNARPGQLHPK